MRYTKVVACLLPKPEQIVKRVREDAVIIKYDHGHISEFP